MFRLIFLDRLRQDLVTPILQSADDSSVVDHRRTGGLGDFPDGGVRELCPRQTDQLIQDHGCQTRLGTSLVQVARSTSESERVSSGIAEGSRHELSEESSVPSAERLLIAAKQEFLARGSSSFIRS